MQTDPRHGTLGQRALGCALLLGALLALMSPAPAIGATVTVDCSSDPAALVTAFGAASSGDMLTVSGTCIGALDIAKDITLVGAPGATLDGQGAIRVLLIRQGTTVVVDGLTITGGVGFAGVGIHNRGTLTLRNAIVSGNRASFWGGGIYNRSDGTLTIERSAVTGNTAGENGGGIHNDGVVTLSDSIVSGNDGGLGGGGVFNSSFGTFTVTSGVFQGNRAQFGGGLAIGGTFRLENATVAANTATHGGGIQVNGGGVVIERSTISGNMALADGGGINNAASLYTGLRPVLRNTTIFGNTAGGSGGGVANTGYIGWVFLEHVTIAGNGAAVSGAGIGNTGFAGDVALIRSIVAAPTQGANCAGPINDYGYNLDDGASCVLGAAGSRSGLTALLDPAGLGANGGATLTVALLPGSPARDAVPLSGGCGAATSIDQRGVARPQGSACDMGAFELVLDTTPPAITVPANVAVDATSPAGATVLYDASASDDVDGAVPVFCNPISGSMFPIAVMTVACTASDSAGNGSTAHFDVRVRGAAEQLERLRAEVATLPRSRGLSEKLEKASKELSQGRTDKACKRLAEFIRQVDGRGDDDDDDDDDGGRRLTRQQIAALTGAAERIRAVLAC